VSRVLVVDDEPGMRAALDAHFLRRGWQVDTATGVRQAISKFAGVHHPLVITDIRMGDGDGFEVMRRVRAMGPRTAVILFTAFASVPQAVAAMKDGACDYLVKPVSFEQLDLAAVRVLKAASLQPPDGPTLIGNSAPWQQAMERARQAAACDADILIEAESGTGKELVARMIHGLSARCDGPFVPLNCTAFPDTLLESELFGFAKGAFTGALASKAGRFESADGGTLLLDEIGEMPLPLQPKLLRALQEREFDQLGSNDRVRVDIRVIATTNRVLAEMVSEGRFRSDLYYRLNVIPLTLPPLRERAEDIPALARYFAESYAGTNHAVGLSDELLSRLQEHAWPGNVRELSNFVRRIVALNPGGEIGAEAFGREGPRSRNAHHSLSGLQAGTSVDQMERELLELTLNATGGNRSRAAEMLGLSLRTVRNKIRLYGLPPRESYTREPSPRTTE